jgi:peroxiredoxin
VNLWATWGIPSQLETPELVKLQKQFRSQGVKFVGLSIENPDTSVRQVRKWIRDYRVNYRIGWITQEVASQLTQGRDVVPQTFVISRTGRIVKRFIGFNVRTTPSVFRLAIEEALNQRFEPAETN